MQSKEWNSGQLYLGERESELLSVSGFDMDGFPYYGSREPERDILRSEISNDFEISQYLTFSTPRDPEDFIPEKIPSSQLSMTDDSSNSLQSDSNKTESQDSKQNPSVEMDSNEQMTLAYHKGHMAYLVKTKTPILPQSRKIMKTKKKGLRNQSYYSQACRYMPNKCRDYCKKFDQKLQQEYEKLSPEEQEKRDVTYEAIAHLNRVNDQESQDLLKAHEKKYLKSRPKAEFINLFVNNLGDSDIN